MEKAPFELFPGMATEPYLYAACFVESIHEAAANTSKQSDMTGMAAVAAGVATSATLIGLMAFAQVASPADQLRYLDRVGRPAAFRQQMLNEDSPPEAANAAEEETKKFDRTTKGWQQAQLGIAQLRTTMLCNLPIEMQRQVMTAHPRMHIIDIVALIRREYIDVVPSTVVDQWRVNLSTPLLSTETVEGSIAQFEAAHNRFPIDEQYRNHHLVNAYLKKLSGRELAAVKLALSISHPTDHTRHWNAAVKAIIRDQILGAREHATTTVGQAMAHAEAPELATAAAVTAAATAPATQPTRPQRPPAGQHYCFAHGRCGHTSFACSKMQQDYGSATDSTNPHLAKFLCTTGNQNVDGVLSSARLPDARGFSNRNSRGKRNSRPK